MKKVRYNLLKLSEHHKLFHGKNVLVIGAGAVGTHEMERIAKLGCSVEAVDLDYFTLENAAKHSGIIRTPEDAGRNKAVCSAERLVPLLDEGCTSNGIDCDVCKLGPEALSDYEYIFIAVDNYAAKILINNLVLQLPKERRPIVIMSGTYNELAQSVILNFEDFCIRCLTDESWLINGHVRTSCTGPQIRRIEGVDTVIRTSNLASSMAAHLALEQFRASVIGIDKAMNRRLTYTAYPNLELSSSVPMKKSKCPGCAICAPKEIKWLKGSVLDVTLKDAFEQITEILGSDDYEMVVHKLEYSEIVYGKFIVEASCFCCGKKIKVMKHEGRTFLKDLLCDECADKESETRERKVDKTGNLIKGFTTTSGEELLNKTLFDLGYSLGAHILVKQRNGALDDLDTDKTVTTYFAFDGDHEKMHSIKSL